MGLDMYLYATRYLSKHDKDKGAKANQIRALFPEMYLTGNLDSVEVQFEAGYWRKANHIHRWFVEHCQDGKDECQISYVGREQLKELLTLCQHTLETKDGAKNLPTTEGFFFGGTEYDEWYWKQTQRTVEIIEKALALPDDYQFKYQSSW